MGLSRSPGVRVLGRQIPPPATKGLSPRGQRGTAEAGRGTQRGRATLLEGRGRAGDALPVAPRTVLRR